VSYSFSFTAATKSEAKERVAKELDNVVNGQPIHSKDREQAQAAATAFIDLVPEPREGECVYVSVHGSVTWSGDTANPNVTGAGVGITAGTSAKPRQQ
jgi:hypothetical protein